MSSMRVFPASGVEWSNVALAPFKTYPIVMFVIGGVWGRGLHGEPMIAYLLLGYLVSLIVVTWAAAVDTFSTGSATTNWKWSGAIVLLGLLFASKWLPTLAQ